MDLTTKFRYPGAPPFSYEDRQIFFGRDEDIERLYKFVRVEQLVVLISKSGLGKSSLLNAGLLPRFLEVGNYIPISLWFSSYRQEGDRLPLELLVDEIKENKNAKTFLDKIATGKSSLWYHLKTHQLAENSEQGFVLIFDQFENFFTYPEESISAFKQQLSDAVNVKIPQKLLRAFREKVMEDPDFFSKEEKDLFFKPLDIKVLFAIRSDKMNLLHSLKDVLPNVLKKTFELSPLNRFQAEDAIVSPAYKKDASFVSETFDFSDKAIEKILHFLTKSGELDEIESAQLQILCQYIEENIVIAKNKTMVEEEDLGNIGTIFSNYYNNIIIGLPKSEQRTARVFIEEGLIFEEDERRLPLDERQIDKLFHVNDTSLKYLVNKRLLRSQPNQTGGFSYELSHDTLVAPILRAKHSRLQKEADAIEEEERRAKQLQLQKKIEEAKKRNKRRGLVALIILLCMTGLAIYFGYNEMKTQKLNSALGTTVKALEAKKDSLLQMTTSLKRSEKKAKDNEAIAKANEARAINSEKVAIKNKLAAVKSEEAALKSEEKAIGLQLKAEKSETRLKVALKNNALAYIENAQEEREAKNYNTAKVYSLFAIQLSQFLSIDELLDEQENIKWYIDYPVKPFKTDYSQKMRHFSMSPDESLLATCAKSSNSIHVWDQGNGRIHRLLEGHAETVNSTSFSGDGYKLATGSDDKTVKIWKLDSEQKPQTLYKHSEPVVNVLYSNEGSYLASASANHIILWNTEDYSIVKEFANVAVAINNMAFSEDGKLFAYTEPNNSIQIINLDETIQKDQKHEKGVTINTIGLKSHAGSVNCLMFSASGKILASGSNDNKIILWDTHSGEQIFTLTEHTAKVTSLTFSPDGSMLASGDASNVIKLWNIPDVNWDVEIAINENHSTVGAGQNNQSTVRKGQEQQTGKKPRREVKPLSSTANLHNHNSKIIGLRFMGGSEGKRANRNMQGSPTIEKMLRLASLGNDERQLKVWEIPDGNTLFVTHIDSASIQLLISKALQQFNLKQKYVSGQHIIISRPITDILHEQAETAYDYEWQIVLYDSILRINPKEYDAVYGLANAYYFLAEYDSAAFFYKKYLAHFENDYTTWNLLGNIYYSIADYQGAIESYNKSIAINKTYHWPFINRGLAYFALGNNTAARENYFSAISLKPEIPGLWNYIGNVYIAEEQYKNAIEAYQKETDLDPENKWAWYNLGYTYKVLNESENAIFSYRRAIEVDPYFTDAWLNLGDLYYSANEFVESAICYLETADLNPMDINSWYYLGGVASKAAFDNAIYFYNRTLEIDSTYAIVWNNLGIVYFKSGDYPNSINAYEKALSISPDETVYLANLAGAHSHSGNDKMAVKYYNRLLISNKVSDSLVSEIIGFAYLKTGQLEKAHEFLKMAEEAFPENLFTKRYWGCYYASKNQTGKAIEYLTKSVDVGYLDFEWLLNEPSLESIRKEDDFVELINRMQEERSVITLALEEVFKTAELKRNASGFSGESGYLLAIESYEKELAIYPADTVLQEDYLFTLEDYAYYLLDTDIFIDAAAVLNKILKTDPFYFSVEELNGFGNDFSDNVHDSLALPFYKKAVQHDPGYYYSWANLGNSYKKTNQTKLAIDAYLQSIKYYPEYVFALNGLGTVYQHDGQYDSALFYFRKAISYDPGYQYSHNNMAYVYLLKGDTLKAKGIFRKVVDSESSNSYALDNLVFLYSLEKQYDSVVYYAQNKATSNLDSSNDWGNMGWYYIFVERYNDALEASDYAFQLDSTATWTKVNLGHALLLMGNFEEAKETYLKVEDVLWNGEPLRKSILADFKTLSKMGISHPDMEKIKAILKEVK